MPALGLPMHIQKMPGGSLQPFQGDAKRELPVSEPDTASSVPKT